VTAQRITTQEGSSGRFPECTSHHVGMLRPSGLDSERAQEKIVDRTPKSSRRGVPRPRARKACEVVEGHLLPAQVHLLLSIPPKYSGAQAGDCSTGSVRISLARTWAGRTRNFTGQPVWARGSWVSPVGRDEEALRQSIREQEQADRRVIGSSVCLMPTPSKSITPPIGVLGCNRFERSPIQASGSAGGT